LSGYGYDNETVAAGLLHDVIEDTTLEAADLDAAVGPRVRELVEAASEPDKTLSWRERKTLDEPLFDELVEAVRQVFGDPETTETDGDTS